MANNPVQLSQLIEQLWANTQSGELHWEQLSDKSNFQTRLGNFVISILGHNQGALGGTNVSLRVKRLDGRMIANVSTGPGNALAALVLEEDRIAPQTEELLKRLFNYLTDRNVDLDELLNILKK